MLKNKRPKIEPCGIPFTISSNSESEFSNSAFCMKTSYFMNKYEPPRWQLCQWSRFAHNRLQSFSISLFLGQNLADVPIWSTNLKLKLITIIVAER